MKISDINDISEDWTGHSGLEIEKFIKENLRKRAANYIYINQNISNPDEIISGDVCGEVVKTIRRNSKHYYGWYNEDSEIMELKKYDPGNSNYDVWMKLPEFWWKCEEIEPDIYKIGFSLYNIVGWNHWDGNSLIGVYKCTQTGSKLRSQSDSSIYLDSVPNLRNKLGKGVSLLSWKHYCIMSLLFFAYYGTTNFKDIFTPQNNIMTGENILVRQDSGRDSQYVNFWGLEDWFSLKSEAIGDICSFYSGDTGVIRILDGTNYRDILYPGLGTIQQTFTSRKLNFGKFGDIIAKSPLTLTSPEIDDGLGYCFSSPYLSFTNQESDPFDEYVVNGFSCSASNSFDHTSRLSYFGPIEII